jgi:hypothetical protein
MFSYNSHLSTYSHSSCTYTILILGSKLGYSIPLPLYISPSYVYITIIYNNFYIKMSKTTVDMFPALHPPIPRSFFKVLVGSLDFYLPYDFVLVYNHLPIQYTHWLYLEVSFHFHLNQSLVNDMIKVMHILFQ